MNESGTAADAERIRELAESISQRALALEAKVAVAESLTGGQVCSALAAAPDASEWFRGGVVAYSSEVKYRLLGVPPGPVVSADAAQAMAEGALATHRATFAVSLTGVGGPGPQEGRPAGTVYLAVAGPAGTKVTKLDLPGDPGEVLALSVQRSLEALDSALVPTHAAQPEG